MPRPISWEIRDDFSQVDEFAECSARIDDAGRLHSRRAVADSSDSSEKSNARYPMHDPHALRWCPHCRRAALHAPLPQLAADEACLAALSPVDDTQVFRRRLYCLQCQGIWDSLELPADAVNELLAARDALEDARRQIAMLRLLSAKERLAEERIPPQPLRLVG